MHTFQETTRLGFLNVWLNFVAEPVHVLVYPVHEEPEDVAMKGPGQKFSSGLPPRPRAGEETLAQPGTQKFVVKTFKIRIVSCCSILSKLSCLCMCVACCRGWPHMLRRRTPPGLASNQDAVWRFYHTSLIKQKKDQLRELDDTWHLYMLVILCY